MSSEKVPCLYGALLMTCPNCGQKHLEVAFYRETETIVKVKTSCHNCYLERRIYGDFIREGWLARLLGGIWLQCLPEDQFHNLSLITKIIQTGESWIKGKGENLS